MKAGPTATGGPKITRRGLLKAGAATAGAAAMAAPPRSRPPRSRAAPTRPAATLRSASDFQVHRTGIGATYGRWYERTANAAAAYMNENGGIAGRPVELVPEDDGTDPKRGAEVVEKFANQHQVDFVYGPLFSHVVIGSAPRAGELKIPYFVVSEGYHVASGTLNRYVFQPGITDVRAQVQAMAPWVTDNLGKRVTMIFPDYAFGYDHRDYFSAAGRGARGSVAAKIAIPPTESSFTRYFPQIPADTEVLYHVMVGPGVLTFVKEMGEHFGSKRPRIFGFIDSLEGVDIASPGLSFLEGTYLWEAMPRYAGGLDTAANRLYREKVGINADGASVDDPKDVSTNSHMFGCWETLYAIKQGVEQSGYRSRTPGDVAALIEAMEGFRGFNEGIGHPAGLQGVQRRAAPVLRAPVHLRGPGRRARSGAHHVDRGRQVRAGGGLHPAVPVTPVGAVSFGPHLLLALLEGAVTACVLAVTALGLSLVFGVMRIVNVAHGEFYMLGAVLAWFCASMVEGSPAGAFLLALLFAPLVVGALALAAGLAHPASGELPPGEHHRRHHRPALPPPAGGPERVRTRCAPGRGARLLPRRLSLVRLLRLQAGGHRGVRAAPARDLGGDGEEQGGALHAARRSRTPRWRWPTGAGCTGSTRWCSPPGPCWPRWPGC